MKIKLYVLVLIGCIFVFTPPFLEASAGKPRKSVAVAGPAFPTNYPVEGTAVPFTRDDFFTFLWSEKLLDQGPFTFVLVPLYEYQKPEQAVVQNKPIYKLENIQEYYINYPWNAPDLGDGYYVWQLTDKKSTVLALVSFQVKAVIPEYQINRFVADYMSLKETLDGSYQIAFDKRVRLYYKEPYALTSQQKLRFRVLDAQRNVMVATRDNGSVLGLLVPPVSFSSGCNWIEINLESCPNLVNDNYYMLEVWNENGETLYLRFRASSSHPSILFVKG